VRIKATEMVGVRLTTGEIRRLLDLLPRANGPGDDAQTVALRRKLTVMLQVATEAEQRPRPWDSR
jgi:hypothetical protein